MRGGGGYVGSSGGRGGGCSGEGCSGGVGGLFRRWGDVQVGVQRWEGTKGANVRGLKGSKGANVERRGENSTEYFCNLSLGFEMD